MIIPNILQYIYGYRYNPNIANEFSYNLEIVRENLTDENLYATDNTNFYKILEDSTDLNIVSEITGDRIAIMPRPDKTPEGYQLDKIITSPMRENSDIIYVYTKSVEDQGE